MGALITKGIVGQTPKQHEMQAIHWQSLRNRERMIANRIRGLQKFESEFHAGVAGAMALQVRVAGACCRRVAGAMHSI